MQNYRHCSEQILKRAKLRKEIEVLFVFFKMKSSDEHQHKTELQKNIDFAMFANRLPKTTYSL